MKSERTILIVEDDPAVYQVVAQHLEQDGFRTNLATDGPDGLAKALSGQYILVILDLNLPGLSGIDICKEIRRSDRALPLIMLTSRESEIERVVGLEVGADDYVVKPFSIFELMARIRARLRIAEVSGQPAHTGIVKAGEIEVDTDMRVATVGGRQLELTRTEFDVLEYFVRNPLSTITRTALLRSVWGTDLSAYEDTVTTIVGRVRRKLEGAGSKTFRLKTVRGVGYILSDRLEPGEVD